MTDNGQFEFLDMVSIASFILSVLNYDENVDQNALSEELNKVVGAINNHLEEQDEKLEKIIKKLGVNIDD